MNGTRLAIPTVSHQKPGTSTRKNWVSNFIKQHDDLISKYTCKYDYQRAECEDPEIIKQWFNVV
jgi:hypothetical protein